MNGVRTSNIRKEIVKKRQFYLFQDTGPKPIKHSFVGLTVGEKNSC